MFCEKCGIKIAERGNYCLSCSTTTKKTLSWWFRLPLLKKIVLGFAAGFIAFQALNFVIAYFMELTDSINGWLYMSKYMNMVCPKCKRKLKDHTRTELAKCSLQNWTSGWKKKWFYMPYGYDKTRTERRCKNCDKLLYVFEVGKLCIDCSRKEPKS